MINMTNKDIEYFLLDLLIKNMFCTNDKIIKIDKKRESPDICVYTKNLNIGIEITRAMDENLAKANSERNRLDKKISFSPIMFENKKMSSKKIKTLLNKSQKKLVASAYRGNELEKIVFCNIKNAINRKIDKFDSYEKFDENWLYIYCEDRASLDIRIVIELLQKYIKKINLKFDILLLKFGKYFYKFDNNKLIKQIGCSKS